MCMRDTVYFPLTCRRPHTIKMFYSVYNALIQHMEIHYKVSPKQPVFYSLASGLMKLHLKTLHIKHYIKHHRRDKGQRFN